MTNEQKKYLSLLVKDRWNELVFRQDKGEEFDNEELNFIQKMFDDNILDGNAVYIKNKKNYEL